MGFMEKLSKWFEGPPPPLEVYRNYCLEAPGYTIDGVLLGMDSVGNPLGKRIGADGHILIVGGAGSGKSSCIAIPTLRYAWKSSALVIDIKGELYEKSSRVNAYVFNPMDRTSAGYDPFYPLYHSANLSSDVEDIAKMIVPMPPQTREPFWVNSAQNILAAHLLYCFKRGATFLQAVRTLQGTPADITMEIIEEEDTEASLFLTQCFNLPPQTLSGIMQELSNRIRPFVTNEFLKSTLSKQKTINPHMLEQGYDIFLQLPMDKLAVFQPITSLIIQQFLRHFEQRPEDRRNSRILFMLDEFPRLGKMDLVVDGLTTLRSKNITVMLIIQSLSQLDAIYGQDHGRIILDNCDCKGILRATDADTQQYFSRLLGTYEREKVSYSSSYTSGEHHSSTSGTSTATEEKPRKKPEEFATFHDVLYFNPDTSGRIKKIPYWEIG